MEAGGHTAQATLWLRLGGEESRDQEVGSLDQALIPRISDCGSSDKVSDELSVVGAPVISQSVAPTANILQESSRLRPFFDLSQYPV